MANDKVLVCFEASYMNYGRISHKARCSMAPRNCFHETSEVITLKTGKRIQVYYCPFNPVKPMAEEKTECRLNGT